MYKVLIVDDEKVIRMAMKSIINWEEQGFEVVGVASDGEEALSIAKEVSPNLILTDLKMPKMDGIQLIKEIKKLEINCKILVLSNYGDYELVRVAMKEGAVDYLLKITLMPKELIAALNGIKEVLAKESESKENEMNLVRELKENKQLAKRTFLLNIVDGELKQHGDIEALCEKYELQNFINCFCVFINIRIDNFTQVYAEKIKDKKKLAASINNLLNESISKEYMSEIILINHHKYGILIKCPEEDYKKVVDMAETLNKAIKFYLNITASIVISGVFQGIYELNKAYEECKTASQWLFYYGNNSIIEASKHKKFNKFDYEYMEMCKVIKESIDFGDFKKSMDLIDNFLEACVTNAYDPQDIKKFSLFIASYVEGYEVDKGIVDVKEVEKLKDDILNCEYIDDLKVLTMELFKQLTILIKDGNGKRYRKEVKEVIDYIFKNIDCKITLKMVAGAVNMNESYLSRMFKNETGENLMYFINKLKMEKALELLKEHGSMVKVVANKVGIDDQFYFNKVFKKFYGVSPSEFKKKYLSKE